MSRFWTVLSILLATAGWFTTTESADDVVFFVGAVVKPGPMQLTQELTLMQALSAVGGPLSIADLESAFVLRGKTRIPVDLGGIEEPHDADLKLQPGDTIVIPFTRAYLPPVNPLLWDFSPRPPPRHRPGT